MSRPVDTVVIGGGTNGLAAAIALAEAGDKVVVAEAADATGGVLRTMEIAPGFRVAPLGDEAGWMPPEVARGLGLAATVPAPGRRVLAAGNEGWLTFNPEPAAIPAGLGPSDAAQWPAFHERIHGLAGILRALYVAPAPRIDADQLGELVNLLKVGRRVRGLGRGETVQLFRTVPMAIGDLLDEWFTSDTLKGALAADAVTDLCQGPISGGTAFNFLHRHVGAPPGVLRARPVLDGSTLVAALTERAAAAGVEVRTGVAAARVEVEQDRVRSVVLADGGGIECRDVVSSLDPWTSLLELIDPVHHDPAFIRAVDNIRFRGAASFVLLALDGLPAMAEGFDGSLCIAPSIRAVEQAFDATKYGEISAEPWLEMRVPSLHRDGLAPRGSHVAVVRVQYTPYRLRGDTWDNRRQALGERVLGQLEARIPGLTSRVLHCRVLAPPDLEREFGLREGAVNHGEMMLDQILFMRPVAGWSRYATPVPGYYLAGSGTHPGGGIAGASGWLAAQAVLTGRKT